jgi:hypothetical protein
MSQEKKNVTEEGSMTIADMCCSAEIKMGLQQQFLHKIQGIKFSYNCILLAITLLK